MCRLFIFFPYNSSNISLSNLKQIKTNGASTVCFKLIEGYYAVTVWNTSSKNKLVGNRDQEVRGHAVVHTTKSRGQRAASKHNVRSADIEFIFVENKQIADKIKIRGHMGFKKLISKNLHVYCIS
jgi:hypothetical protein